MLEIFINPIAGFDAFGQSSVARASCKNITKPLARRRFGNKVFLKW